MKKTWILISMIALVAALVATTPVLANVSKSDHPKGTPNFTSGTPNGDPQGNSPFQQGGQPQNGFGVNGTKQPGNGTAGDLKTYNGTISSVSDSSLTITEESGSTDTFVLTSSTRIEVGGSDDYANEGNQGNNQSGNSGSGGFPTFKGQGPQAFPTFSGSTPAALPTFNSTPQAMPTQGASVTATELLASGDKVLVKAIEDSSDTLTAVEVKVLSDNVKNGHYIGSVTAYESGSSITITDLEGSSYTFEITSTTKILPKELASELAVGSEVTIFAMNNTSTGTLIAKVIAIHPAIETPTATVEATETPTPTE